MRCAVSDVLSARKPAFDEPLWLGPSYLRPAALECRAEAERVAVAEPTRAKAPTSKCRAVSDVLSACKLAFDEPLRLGPSYL
jgi:hypothetical protein